jgi:DNA polymerase elongation subunit (family B)
LEDKKKYINLSIRMSHLAAAQIDDVLGTIKVAEMSIINYCHYALEKKIPDHTPPEPTGEKYDGATVIDPQAGLHSFTGSVDLASLYPTTMRSLNISPETIVGQFLEKNEAFTFIRQNSNKPVTFTYEKTGKSLTAPAHKWKKVLKEKNWVISAMGTVFHQDYDGVIPSILSSWYSERKEYKKKMKDAGDAGDEALQEYYDNMQFIKKIQLNSMYGACGNRFFKFYDVRLAESTTLSGREVLFHMAKKIAEKQDGEYTMPSPCIIYGDTDSVYFATYQDNKEDALRVAQELCTYVNDSWSEFMTETFNCDDNHNGLQKAEQEIISDNGLFIKKKYYILHLNYSDGKEVDKIKDMGVPIKKTTLPKHIKEKLRGFIERLLKGESWDTIGPDIVMFKDELKQTDDILSLGLPKGVKNLENYTQRFNDKEKGLRLPGGQAASIMWNACLEKYGDKESPPIISGSKIQVFYLTRNIGNFRSIAVPKDLSAVPHWFSEHFVPIIDRDAQIQRLVDDPMEIMISVANIKVPTKKKLKLEEGLFE